METLKTLFKCCLTAVILLIATYASAFAFDSPSWFTNILILAFIILVAAVVIRFLWRRL